MQVDGGYSGISLSVHPSLFQSKYKILKILCHKLLQLFFFKPITRRYILDSYKLRVCRRQFQIWRKWQKVIHTGRKHWEKEKLLVTSNFSFYQCFQKACFPGVQKVSLCGNRLNFAYTFILLCRFAQWNFEELSPLEFRKCVWNCVFLSNCSWGYLVTFIDSSCLVKFQRG